MIKNIVRKLIPERAISLYHFVIGALAAVIYRYPSERLRVIGVTGTSGKSTTVHLLRHLLESGGHKVGSLSTVDFYMAGQSKLNDRKMTMLGRFATQSFLARALRAGCDYAIIETTSQGVLQHRHRFINYDAAVLTNFYPEHLEAHGSFENYKAAKLAFFHHVTRGKRKGGLAKAAVINGDNPHAQDFALGGFDHIFFFGEKPPREVLVSEIKSEAEGLSFKLNGTAFQLPFLGEFNAYNFAAAAAYALSQGLALVDLAAAASKITPVPGHSEFINAGQKFKVLVDYAFEPVAMAELYKIVNSIKKGRVIHVLGSAGGGRDTARREVLGGMAGEEADVVVVTNEDPYDDDPALIIEQVAAGAAKRGKRINDNLFKILDRRQGIAKALSLAQPDDLVLVTGKGAEQAICTAGGKKIPWDDRIVIREILRLRPPAGWLRSG